MSRVHLQSALHATVVEAMREVGFKGLLAIRRLKLANAPLSEWIAECRRLHGVTEEDGSGRLATVDASCVVRDVRVA